MYKKVNQITCPPKFKNQCPVDWSSLEGLHDSADRWCSICKKQVHRTDDPKELEKLAQDGKCVAVLYEKHMLLGSIALPSNYAAKGDLVDSAKKLH